jgi:phosphohistidine swiveling domain-containing protein
MPAYVKTLKLIPRDYEAKWLQVFFARPYWNLGEVKKALESLPGFDETAFYQDLGVDYDDGGERKVTPVTLTGVLRALPTLFALKRSYRDVIAHNRAFVARFDEAKAPYDLTPAELAAVPRDELARKLRTLIEELYIETETSYFTTIYNTSNSKTDFKPVFDKVNKVAGGELGQIELMGGLVDLSHLRPMKALHELAGELAAAGGEVSDEVVAEFAWQWRHHGKKELDIRVPRWTGDHAFVRAMIERAVAGYSADADPEKNEARQHQRYVDARRAIERKLRWRPLLRRSFGKKLDLVRTYAWWREEMRDYSSFAYYLVHSWAAEAGRRLAGEGAVDDPDDVWYLPYPELLDAVDGTLAGDELAARVRAGRRNVASFRNFDNPNEIGTHVRQGGGEVSADALRGTPCSPGRVTGRARVVRSLEEADALEAGDILVTVFTDPGWTPLFSSISAVVTETGGVLSHAAVISREYGIPAVLAVAGATRAIPDGATITVDGASGAVEVED